MGLGQEQFPRNLPAMVERSMLASMEQLRFYDDAIGYIEDIKADELERTIAPGGTFTLNIPFSPKHPMFVGKSHEEQKALMQRVRDGDFSDRSKIVITGVTDTVSDERVSLLDDGTWVLRRTFANDGPLDIIVPTAFRIGKPFERPEQGLSGRELRDATRNLSDLNHIQFVTKSGVTVDPETLSDEVLENPDSPLYPVAVFLPYTEEVGNLKSGPAINLGNVPGRKEGYEDRYVDWDGKIGYNVILKRTRGIINIPEGFVGVIRENGINGEVPHSRSTLLDSDPVHKWKIVGEHPLRNAGNEKRNPTGFAMDLYRVA